MRLNSYDLPGTDHKVRVSTTFEDADMSGETSSSSRAHKGIKPKEFSVSFVVNFDDSDSLGEFYRVAQAVDDNGDLVVYEVTERTANAVNVQQVSFSGRLDTVEIDDLQAWQVSFKLKEFLSVPEKTEQRTQTLSEEPEQTAGVTVATDESGEPQPQSSFESMLKRVDQALATSNETS
ncbi:MAG: hypothetical protein ACRBBW_17185 [Cellvibrionaceae bacterium]